MKDTRYQEILSLAIATVLSAVLMGVVILLNKGPETANLRDPLPYGWSWSFDYRQALPVDDQIHKKLEMAPSQAQPLTLVLDQPVPVGGIIIIYRGKSGRDHFRVDTIISELDPEYPYSQEMDVDQARRGFSLGDERFVLQSIGKNYLRLRTGSPD